MTLDAVGTRPRALPARPATPGTRLRHRVTEANLRRHVRGPQRVLDVAGGHGEEAVALALRGHEVTVLDPAGAVLAAAMHRADTHGVADRVHVVQAAAEDAPEVFRGHDFDVVLCHNLLHYADDRVALLRAVAAPVRAGGVLSVLGPNPAAAPLSAALRDRDPERALRELDPTTPGPTAEQVRADLGAAGATVEAHYGVHCVAGYLPVDDPGGAEPGFQPRLEALELAMSTRAPYLHTARFHHLVARC